MRCNLERDTNVNKVLRGFGGSIVSSLGEVSFSLRVDDIERVVRADVVPDYCQNVPLLIGQPWTEHIDTIVIKDYKTLKFVTKQSDICDIECGKELRKVALKPTRDVLLLPNQWHNVEVEVADSSHEGDLFVEAGFRYPVGQEYCIPRTVISLQKGGTTVLPVINLSDTDLTLKTKQILARAYPCEQKEHCEGEQVLAIREAEVPEIAEEQVNIGPITEHEKGQLLGLINKYKTCFSTSLCNLGCAKSTKMEIRLNDNEPFTYRPYRMAEKERSIVDGMVQDLIDNEIVRSSDSPYASPVLLVKKKNGESRLCIDYRKLNEKTVKDRYPLPRIDDQIDRLHGSRFFTSLDLRSGYYQVPIAETSKRYTAFVTPFGQYEFNRMPSGLANAPSCFSRLKNKVLAPAKNITAVYLDDILIHTKTVQQGLENLEKIFTMLREEGLTLNLEKCTFLDTSILYLGYQIEDGMVKPGRDKTRAVNEFPTPENVHQVRQFLGLTGYFRHFVKDYSSIAKPLTNLLK